MPSGASCVDNFAANGLAAPVELTDGTLGPAIKKDIRAGLLYQHPDSGMRIVGLRLPFWNETVVLCALAHRCFSTYPFIGWDVVITADEPLLLEANLTWCVDLVQMTNMVPLGQTAFPQVFMAQIRDEPQTPIMPLSDSGSAL
jgi:hypothetical protein